MLIDNVKQIREYVNEHLSCYKGNDSFFKFEAIIRKKDNTDNPLMADHKSSWLVHAWVINSIESFDKHIDSMKLLCELTGARLYVSADMKSTKKAVMTLSDSAQGLVRNIVNNNELSTKNIFNLMNSTTSRNCCSVHNERKYLFDIDNNDVEVKEELLNELKCLQDIDIYELRTLNGWHVITNRFDLNTLSLTVKLNPNLDVKENALTLVYFKGGIE